MNYRRVFLQSSFVSLAMLFTACIGSQDSLEIPSDKNIETHKIGGYAKKMRELRYKKRAAEVQKNHKKHCFKNSKSIHYKASERCKK